MTISATVTSLKFCTEVYNPMPYVAARDMEVELAIGLREAGYGYGKPEWLLSLNWEGSWGRRLRSESGRAVLSRLTASTAEMS